jgi:hypothetical protein
MTETFFAIIKAYAKTQIQYFSGRIDKLKKMTNKSYPLFEILNFGHWNLFEICDLEFVILIIAEPET